MSIDRRIHDFIGIQSPIMPWLRETPAMGIELEYEQANLRNWPENMRRWSVSGDGSLRARGVELISNPLRLGHVEAALVEAEHAVDCIDAIATERCGLHIHLNMRPYSVGQIWSLAALYALVEPTLYQTYAINRENSIFGVPMWANQPVARSLYRDITRLRSYDLGADVRGVCTITSTSKYSALNFSCLSTLGTVEMRQPYCTNNFNAIRSWVAFNERLYEQGVFYVDPLDVLTKYEEDGLSALQNDLFGCTYDIDPEVQEQADDAAYFIAGFTEPRWNELDWADITAGG